MTELKDDLAALRIEREPERASAGPLMLVRWAILLIVLAGGVFAAWKWYSRERPVEVEVGSITQRAAGTQAGVLDAAGYVTARRRATVSSKITGKVVEVNVEEGMAVQEGQILARLDDVTAKASLALAEAQVNASKRTLDESEVRLAEAKVTLKRMVDLLKGGIVGQAEVDTAQAQVDSIAARIQALNQQTTVAERQADFARTNLDDTIIRAPFSGVAISRDAQAGEMVSPVSAGGGFTRTGICTIVDMRSLEIEVDVNQNYINRVEPKMDVVAVLDAYPDWQIPGFVITPVPTGDRAKNTVLVRIGFKQLDKRILPDMSIKVKFLRGADEAAKGGLVPMAKPMPLVPKTAIRVEGTESVVFVVTTDRVERRAIQTGGTDGDRLEVLAGLQPGDRVVLSPPPALTAGMLIKVK
jgi:RND family efflux transporter MFP subunit